MSILIDKVSEMRKDLVLIKGSWYISKPLPNISFKNKIKDCIKILKGKAIAVHYKEDEEE